MGLLKYPLFGEVESNLGLGIQNYHAFTASLNKRFSGGLQFLATYTFARNLTDGQGWNPAAFATEVGGNASNLSNARLDYGNVAFTRRNRFLGTFLYQLPFGKGALSVGRAGNAIVGGWELAGVLVFQSGPFLTVTVPGADPAGVGFPQIEGNGRADIVSGTSVYPANQSIHQWLNPAAFAVPPNNIGRFPTSSVGIAQGPGTQAVSLSLLKTLQVRERSNTTRGADGKFVQSPELLDSEHDVQHICIRHHQQPAVGRGRWPPHHSGHVARFVLITADSPMTQIPTALVGGLT